MGKKGNGIAEEIKNMCEDINMTIDELLYVEKVLKNSTLKIKKETSAIA